MPFTFNFSNFGGFGQGGWQSGGQSGQEDKEQQGFPHGYSSPPPSIRSSAWSTRPGS